jgi:5-methylcytosine-specific restriction endonuclease McrA
MIAWTTEGRPCRGCQRSLVAARDGSRATKCQPCKAEAQRIYYGRRNANQIPKAVREAVCLRDGPTCRYCGCTVRKRKHYRDFGPDTYELDHVVRVVDGGRSTIDNLVVSCFSCNRKRQWVAA